jgi:hypothetical protein
MIRWTDLPLAGALGALAVARAVLAGGLAGSPGAEVYGHAWVQWWCTSRCCTSSAGTAAVFIMICMCSGCAAALPSAIAAGFDAKRRLP